MRALLPEATALLGRVEQILASCAAAAGYSEIRLPLLERTELFTRSIGEATDIIGKEMYSFDDRDGESLSLRPEGTAGCSRALIEHSLVGRRPARLWYSGPMFRYERPQKGRSRQFFQFGVEAVGMDGEDIEVELLLLGERIWRELGVADRVELQIASLGNEASRNRYRDDLVSFLEQHRDQLDESSLNRLHTNPLRILDSKSEQTRELLQSAPVLTDYLDEQSAGRFERVRGLLEQSGVKYRINPHLVRGLDYYCHTVFEWVATRDLGAQGTLCAGGRYDGLLAMLGGPEVPAAGFALGLDRLLLLGDLLKSIPAPQTLQFFIAIPSGGAQHFHLSLAEKLRRASDNIRVLTYMGNSSLKAQMKQADAEGFDYVLLAGEREVAQGQMRARSMREGTEQLFDAEDLDSLLEWTAKGEAS